jgi:hypothetical protein
MEGKEDGGGVRRGGSLAIILKRDKRGKQESRTRERKKNKGESTSN